MIEDLKKSVNIIVVDDSDFSRKTIVEILENENWNVVGQAKSAEEALQISQSSNCNIFIIDVVMPEISGIDLAKHFAESTSFNGAIVMISSLVTENIIIDSISNGATDFIQKPFEKKDLLQSIEKVSYQLHVDRML